MGYALLWVESLAAALLLLVLLAALMAGRRFRVLIPAVAFTTIFLIAAAATLLAFAGRSRNISPDWSWYTASWTVLYAVAGVQLVRRGSRGSDVTTPVRPGRLALATLVAWGLLFLTFDHISARVDRTLALVAASERAMVASFEAEPVADRENAAVVYQEAFEQLDALAPGLPDWFKTCGAPCGGARAKPEDVVRVREASQPVLAVLRRGAALPRFRFGEFDYARPYASPVPSLLHYRRSANLLALDGLHRAQQGDTRSATADVAAIWRMSQHLAAGRTVIEHLVAVALQGIGTDALEGALAASTAWRAEDLAVLSAAAPPSLQRSLTRAWRLEESGILLAMANWGVGTDRAELAEDLLGSPVSLLSPIKVFLLTEDVRSYQEWMQKALDLYRKPPYTTAAERAAFAEDFARAPKGLITSIALPSVLRAWVATFGADTRARLARLAVAVTGYQLKNKRPPARPDELVPDFIDAVPVDPFGGKPLGMIAADGGLVLYGIGGDLKDDGGAREDRHAGDLKGDITFCMGGAYAARRAPSPPAPAPKR